MANLLTPAEQSADGQFIRQEGAFCGWVQADGTGSFPAASGRYHLYLSLAWMIWRLVSRPGATCLVRGPWKRIGDSS